MLKGIKILDFTQRLPGPLAGKILTDLGAEVIKIEDTSFKDSFISEKFIGKDDTSFFDWYEELNKNKKVLRLDFKSPLIKNEIEELLKDTDGIILSLSDKKITELGLNQITRPMGVVKLLASKDHHQSMHDLNALALTGLLSLHITDDDREVVPPPFLPIAGISFGQQVATTLLAATMKSQKTNTVIHSTVYLYDNAQNLLSLFWPKHQRELKKTHFLHNGAYPCYCLYRTKDFQYVALAAVEEKYWLAFTEAFQIPLSTDDRFSTDKTSFDLVARSFAKLTSVEIEKMTHNQELCLSIVRKV